MYAAELPAPQSAWLAMWPDHDRTAVVPDAVNQTVIEAALVPAYDPVRLYALGFAAIVHDAVPQRSPVFGTVAPDVTNEPPSMRNVCPVTWVTPAPVTTLSTGMANVFVGATHVKELLEHGFAVVSVRATDVK